MKSAACIIYALSSFLTLTFAIHMDLVNSQKSVTLISKVSVSKWWKARRVHKEAKITILFKNDVCLWFELLCLSSMQIFVITPLCWQLGHINQATSIAASFYLQLHIVLQRNSAVVDSVETGLIWQCFAQLC